MRELDEQKGQCEPDEEGRPLLPASLEDAVPGCHGDDRLLWQAALWSHQNRKGGQFSGSPFYPDCEMAVNASLFSCRKNGFSLEVQKRK